MAKEIIEFFSKDDELHLKVLLEFVLEAIGVGDKKYPLTNTASKTTALHNYLSDKGLEMDKKHSRIGSKGSRLVYCKDYFTTFKKSCQNGRNLKTIKSLFALYRLLNGINTFDESQKKDLKEKIDNGELEDHLILEYISSINNHGVKEKHFYLFYYWSEYQAGESESKSFDNIKAALIELAIKPSRDNDNVFEASLWYRHHLENNKNGNSGSLKILVNVGVFDFKETTKIIIALGALGKADNFFDQKLFRCSYICSPDKDSEIAVGTGFIEKVKDKNEGERIVREINANNSDHFNRLRIELFRKRLILITNAAVPIQKDNKNLYDKFITKDMFPIVKKLHGNYFLYLLDSEKKTIAKKLVKISSYGRVEYVGNNYSVFGKLIPYRKTKELELDQRSSNEDSVKYIEEQLNDQIAIEMYKHQDTNKEILVNRLPHSFMLFDADFNQACDYYSGGILRPSRENKFFYSICFLRKIDNEQRTENSYFDKNTIGQLEGVEKEICTQFLSDLC